MTIAESLKRFRKTFNLKQKDVADTLGVKQQSYQVYESGTKPSAEVIVKLADAYDVSTDYLLGRTESPRPAQFDEQEVKEAFAFRDMWQNTIERAILKTAPAAAQVPAQ